MQVSEILNTYYQRASGETKVRQRHIGGAAHDPWMLS